MGPADDAGGVKVLQRWEERTVVLRQLRGGARSQCYTVAPDRPADHTARNLLEMFKFRFMLI